MKVWPFRAHQTFTHNEAGCLTSDLFIPVLKCGTAGNILAQFGRLFNWLDWFLYLPKYGEMKVTSVLPL